ncbi:MAG: ABC transporter substrate-binding protein [Bacteroidales bacterium]|nr:ABC transporter substrate-binding protein [Bacteroidales bacterium]
MRFSLLCLILFSTIFCACNSSDSNHKKQQVFRYNESKGISSLDPAFARNLPLIWPVHQIFNGLVQLDDSLKVRPCIAKKWEVSNDGKVFTFLLRSDVYFHCSEVFPDSIGRKVIASDFVYSFNRILNPEIASPGAWVLSSLEKDRVGTHNGCMALNDSVFQVYLKKPFPAFLGMLTMPYCYVIPHEAIEFYGREFRNHPVGTGPFFFKYWKEGEKLILRRNSKYFEKDSKGVRFPYLESISISFIADKQSEFLEFIKGNIDFISGVNPASKDELLTRNGNLNPRYLNKIKMITGPYLNTEYLGILIDGSNQSFKSNPLLLNKVRKAIGYGIDRSKMMMYLRSNIGYPAFNGFIPNGMPDFKNATKGFCYNPELSQELLKEVGYSTSKTLPLLSLATTDDYVDICEFIQHQLNNLGFDIKVDVYPGAAYREMLANSKLKFFRASWVADYADPENYLALFNSVNFSPSGPNYTHFKSEIYNNLYANSLSEISQQKRLKLYKEMDSIIIDNAVVIPLYYDKVIRFIQNDVEGMECNPMNLLILKNVKKQIVQ